MLTLGIMIFIFLVILITTTIKNKSNFVDSGQFFDVHFLLFFISLLMLVFISMTANLFLEPKTNLNKTSTLLSLRNGSGIQGNFFLISRSLRSVQYYIGYVKIGESSYKQFKIPSESTIIVESDSENPRI